MYQKLITGIIFVFCAANHGIAGSVEAGAQIFEELCIHCHRLDYNDKFGPGLAGITDRRDTAWLDKFLKDPAKMIKSDEYAHTLRENNKYGLTMPSFPEMQDAKKRQDMIEFLKVIQ